MCHQSLMLSHFKFLQLVYPCGSNTPRFQAKYLAVSYLPMTDNLQNIKEDGEMSDSKSITS